VSVSIRSLSLPSQADADCSGRGQGGSFGQTLLRLLPTDRELTGRLLLFASSSFLITHAHLDHVSSLILGTGGLPPPCSSKTGGEAWSTVREVYGSLDTLLNLETVFGEKVWPDIAGFPQKEEDNSAGKVLRFVESGQTRPDFRRHAVLTDRPHSPPLPISGSESLPLRPPLPRLPVRRHPPPRHPIAPRLAVPEFRLPIPLSLLLLCRPQLNRPTRRYLPLPPHLPSLSSPSRSHTAHAPTLTTANQPLQSLTPSGHGEQRQRTEHQARYRA